MHVQAAPVLVLIRAVKHVQALRRFEEVSVNAQDQVTFFDVFSAGEPSITWVTV